MRHLERRGLLWFTKKGSLSPDRRHPGPETCPSNRAAAVSLGGRLLAGPSESCPGVLCFTHLQPRLECLVPLASETSPKASAEDHYCLLCLARHKVPRSANDLLGGVVLESASLS